MAEPIDTSREAVEVLARQCDVLRDGLVGSVVGPAADTLRALLTERDEARQTVSEAEASLQLLEREIREPYATPEQLYAGWADELAAIVSRLARLSEPHP